MTPRPHVTEEAHALDVVEDMLNRSQPNTFELEILGYAGNRFIVGATFTDGEKRVYYVGPRGGIDRWLSADPEWAAHLAAFLVKQEPRNARLAR